MPCGPLGYAGGTNLLYRNRGDGTFEDVSEASGIARPRGPSSMVFVGSNWRPTGSYGMGAAAADFDNDGWPDIYVACDTAPSQLYRNNHDGTFREVAVPAGCAFDEDGVALAGHGRRRRRLRRRRLARHRPHELLRAGDHALPELRSRRVRGREPQGRPRRQPEVRRLRRRTSSTSTTTAGRTSSSPTATCTRSWTSRKLHLTYRQPKLLYRNLGQRPLRRRVGGGGAGHHVAESRPRLRLRRSRQRRRRRHRRQQPGRPADAAAQRWREQAQLDPDQVRRHAIEPVGDRDPGEGHQRRTSADRRGDERFELLLAERLPPPFRAGRAEQRWTRRDRLAVGPQGDIPRPPGQPPLRHRRDEGHRQPAASLVPGGAR